MPKKKKWKKEENQAHGLEKVAGIQQHCGIVLKY